MKPHRMRMTHNLLLAYGLLEKMDVLPTPRASQLEMTRFHSDEYIQFLHSISPECVGDHARALCRFNVLEDCPVFDGLWEYCQIAAGGSLAGASRLNAGDSDIALNWAGGLHHAKKAEASGFCYINDCVLAILELLKVHARVLYVDIDIHHGDGVEEAFYTTDRVMTTSFHKFGDYFPGTGDVTDVGVHRGKHYSANFPLRDGIDDESYREIFVPVMSRIMEWFQPGAVVLQCGADSLSGDRLGCFNLSLLGHAQCVDFFKRYDKPLLLLGGGGYTIRNVARCWAYETSRVLGETLSDELPYNENYEFYGPEFRLHIVPSNMENHNSSSELHKTKVQIFEHLRHLPHAPSVPMIDTPRHSPMLNYRREEDTGTATVAADDDEDDPDIRKRSRRPKKIIDYAGSDDDCDDQYISSLRDAKRKYKRVNFSRRRFPRAVLSTGDKSREADKVDKLSAPHQISILGRSSKSLGTSVFSTAPGRENDIQEWVSSRAYKSRRRDRASQYYEIDADGMMEDSRRTVSGMSNVKVGEIEDGQELFGRAKFRTVIAREPGLTERQRVARTNDDDDKSEYIHNVYMPSRRETIPSERRIESRAEEEEEEGEEEREEESPAMPYVDRRGAKRNCLKGEAKIVSEARQHESVGNEKEGDDHDDDHHFSSTYASDRRVSHGEGATKKATLAHAGVSSLEVKQRHVKGSEKERRLHEVERAELSSNRVQRTEASEGNGRKHDGNASYEFTDRKGAAQGRRRWAKQPYFPMTYNRSDRPKVNGNDGDIESDDAEGDGSAADDREDSAESEGILNGDRTRNELRNGKSNAVENDNGGVVNGEDENGMKQEESHDSRDGEDDEDAMNGNDDRGDERNLEGGLHRGNADGGGDEEDSDNGHGDDEHSAERQRVNRNAQDSVEGDVRDEGDENGQKNGKHADVVLDLERKKDGGVNRRGDAVGDDALDSSCVRGGSNEEDSDKNGDGDTEDVRRRGANRTSDDGSDERERRIRGARPIERWKTWSGKRRAVLDDEASGSEHEDANWKGKEKRDGASGSAVDKDDNSGREDGDQKDGGELIDSAKVRDSSGRFVSGGNGRSIDAPR